MSNYDEIMSLTLGGAEEETENEETLSGEVIDAESGEREAISSILSLLSRMRELSPGDANDDDDNDDDDDDGDSDDNDNSSMDAHEYHNKAVDYARMDNYKRASSICIEGLKRFPTNVDLLADTIKYSSASGDTTVSDAHYLKLRKLPFSRWNWRAFTFSFDYLLERDPVGNESENRLLVEQYKRFLPYEEKACMAESELEAALGNKEQSMNVLVDSIKRHPNASQCALRLADMQFERGLYADVVRTCNYGLAASAAPQPSINIPYLLFLRALSKDHLLIEKANNGPVKASEIEAIRDEYKLLLEKFPRQMMRHSGVIETRRSVLMFISHEE